MLLLFAVLAGIAAAILLVRYMNRQTLRISETNRFHNIEPENLRPLFAPTDDDLRAGEREQAEQEAAERRGAEEAAREEQEAQLMRLLSAWRSAPTRQDAIDLLERSVATGEADVFAEVAEEILKVSNEQGAGAWAPDELAALIDSHIRLLPQAERSSGALFWLKEETARLRSH